MNHRDTSKHPDELLLAYLENILSLDEKLMVEKHLESCPECSQRIERLRHVIELLVNNREAFCPDLWELYAFVHYRQDDLGTIAAHLNECPACREACEQLRQDVFSTEMPDQLNQRLKERLRETARKAPEHEGLLTVLWARFSRFSRAPSIAGAAVAVAALLLIVFWPREIPHAVIATSTVEWTGVSRPKALQPQRKRTAIIISLKGFSSPLLQQEVDGLYQAAAPNMAMFEQSDFVTPAAVYDAVRRMEPPAKDSEDVLTMLRTQLGVSQALLITVQSLTKGFEIEGRMVDLVSRHSSGRQIVKLDNRSDLEPKIRDIAHSFLSRGPAEREDASH